MRKLPHPVFRLLMRARAGRFTVGLVAVISWQGKLLFVAQRYRSGWSMPGGSINHNERPEEGAARELREEVGLHCDLSYRTHVVENSNQVHNVMFIYTAELDDGVVPPIEAGIEIAEVRWAEPAELWPDLHREVKRVLIALGMAPEGAALAP